MPTYAQLQAESWWGREIVTPELDWLGDELCRRTRRPRAAAGTKGDSRHLRGSHRSQEWIEKSRYCTDRHYTVQSGLTDTQRRHVAGFDFNPGSDAAMKALSRRIIAAMKAGRLDEVVEFFGTTDGRTVDGWDNRRNRKATSDSSHLWHWHLSIDRRHCADRRLMERIVAIALGEDDDMQLSDRVNLVQRPDVKYSSTATTVEGVLASTNYYVLQTRNKLLAEMAALRTQLAAVTAALESLAQAVTAGGGSVDVAAIKAHIDVRVAEVRADLRDAVADLGEGGAAQVRGPQG